MPVGKLKELLDREEVKYVSIAHSPAFTAQEIAASAHIPGKEVAKTVMVKLDGTVAMAVLPAPARVDLDRLRDIAGAGEIELAGEAEFKRLFPECETGAMPPFGNLYGLDVWVDRLLAEDEEIAFNAGSHAELIRMGYGDFERLVKPKLAEFATPKVEA
ncbi:MAG: YbaK/EbsC family protein [Acidobacteriota bacterium]|nr:YbaK/EbsC family protein [Acidobacteriota bacterium]